MKMLSVVHTYWKWFVRIKAFLRLMRIPGLYKKVLGIFAAQTPKLFGISAGFEADAVRTTGGVAHRYLQRHTGGAGHSGTVRQRDGAVHRRGDRRPPLSNATAISALQPAPCIFTAHPCLSAGKEWIGHRNVAQRSVGSVPTEYLHADVHEILKRMGWGRSELLQEVALTKV